MAVVILTIEEKLGNHVAHWLIQTHSMKLINIQVTSPLHPVITRIVLDGGHAPELYCTGLMSR